MNLFWFKVPVIQMSTVNIEVSHRCNYDILYLNISCELGYLGTFGGTFVQYGYRLPLP